MTGMRNMPCPCGSGKKYKHCCQHADRSTEQLDVARLLSIASLEAKVSFGDAYLPYIKPLQGYENFMDFDREVCEAGLKEYIRPSMDSDKPKPEHASGTTTPEQIEAIRTELSRASYMHVVELRPGIRKRAQVAVIFPELN